MPSLTCTICSEVYTNTDVIYSTACGHIFHFACMQQWRSRSTSCPQCREHNPTTHRVFLDFDETANEQKITELQAFLEQSQEERNALQLQFSEIETNFYDMQRVLASTEEKNIDLESANQYLKAQNDSREDEIAKLINNFNEKASEEAELLRVQLTSLEERLKELLLDLEQKTEECLKLQASNKPEKYELLYESTRRQYEAVEKGLKVQIEHLNQEIIAKNSIIEKQQSTIAELTANNTSSEKCAEIDNVNCETENQKCNQYIDNNSTEMLMQKLRLERQLEKSLDKIMELEESHLSTKEMLNLEIDSLKTDIERKDNEIQNRKDEHAKMMNRLSTLGSKATEISLRKRNEILMNKLEETRCELEKAFKSCAEKDANILKLKQAENLVKAKLEKLIAQEQLQKEQASLKEEPITGIVVSDKKTVSHEDQNEIECDEGKIVTSVVLTGVPQGDIKVPLIDTVLIYTTIMDIPCTTADISDVSKLESKRGQQNDDKVILHVKFATIALKVQFLLKKDKLRPRGINVSEYRGDKEKNALFYYAKMLKTVGYSTVFCKNNIVYAKLTKRSPLIKINCRRDVDDLVKEGPPKNVSEECDDAYYRQ